MRKLDKAPVGNLRRLSNPPRPSPASERAYLTPAAEAAIERGFALNREAWQLLDLIVAEWNSDPMSVQCFDLRIVNRAKDAVALRKEIDKVDWVPMLGDE